MTDKVIVLPCTKFQKELILFLKKRFFVIGIDPNKTVSTKLLDQHIISDIKHLENLCIENVLGVYTDQSDIAVIPSVNLSKRLNCKSYEPSESIYKFSCDKYQMYCHAEKVRIPVGEFQKLNTFDELKIPDAILKPSDTANSRGVLLASDENAFDRCKSFTKLDFILAQKRLEGLQITVEGFCLNNKHYSLTASYKGDYMKFAFTSSLKWPLNEVLSERELKILFDQNNHFVESTGIKKCITHAEYIYDGSTFYLNEIACRGGGFYISSHIVPHVTGVNLYDCFFNEKIPCVQHSKVAFMKFYTEPLFKKKSFGNSVICDTIMTPIDNPRNSYAIFMCENNDELESRIRSFENDCFNHD